MRSYSALVPQTMTELFSSSAMTRMSPRAVTLPTPPLMGCPALPMLPPKPLPAPPARRCWLPVVLLLVLRVFRVLVVLLVVVLRPGATPLVPAGLVLVPPKMPESTSARCLALPFCTW